MPRIHAGDGTTSKEDQDAPSRPQLPSVDGLKTVDDAMTYLARIVMLLDHIIVGDESRLSVAELARLSSTQGMNLSRYVRMHRDKAVLNGELDAQFDNDLAEALRLVSQSLEVEL